VTKFYLHSEFGTDYMNDCKEFNTLKIPFYFFYNAKKREVDCV